MYVHGVCGIPFVCVFQALCTILKGSDEIIKGFSYLLHGVYEVSLFTTTRYNNHVSLATLAVFK